MRNTDTSTDINVTTPTDVPLTGTTDFIDTGFTVVGDGIECNFTGQVRVTFSVYMTSTGSRPSLDFTVCKNGTSVGPIYNQNYIRNSSGHDVSGTSGSVWVSVSSGDDITIRSDRVGTVTSSVTLGTAGGSLLLLERWD